MAVRHEKATAAIDGRNAEFERIRLGHRNTFRHRVAREVRGSSVIRVFASGTKIGLLKVLYAVPVDELLEIGRDGFRSWYEIQLERIATEVRRLNSSNSRVLPGLKWGHSGKLLSLYLRDLVLHTRYFQDADVRRISDWLHVPIYGILIRRLRRLGVCLPFRQIREVDSREKFYHLQNLLEEAAKKVGVPRVWIDDNWAERM